MIDTLPEDVITLILNNLEKSNPLNDSTDLSYLKMDINFILSLRNINKYFKNYIETKKNIWFEILRDNRNGCFNTLITEDNCVKILDNRSKEIDDLCLKNTPLHVFQWLFENNIHLSIKNIHNLIIKNRVDVFNKGLQYREFLKIIFNRFHLCSNNDILSLSKNINPMSTAVRYDRVNIIKLLLEKSKHGNPYLDQIESIFEESIKYLKTGTLNYLLVNYYHKLKEVINRKFNTIILRFSNIEDTLFYIVVNQKVQITRENMKSLISKNYIELFKYCYEKNIRGKNNSDLLLKCVESNSFVIFDYLMENGSYINPSEFSSVFLSKKKHNIIFLNMILDKYVDLLPLNTNIISLSIKNKVDFERIQKLINNNYHYDEKDIIIILEDKNIKLAKLMINAYQCT
jgi:hypothetical protein